METQNHLLCSSTVGLEMGGTTGLEQGTGNTLPTHQSDAEIQRAPHSCLTTVSRVATPAHSDMKYLAKCVVVAASEGNKDSKTSVSKHTGDVSKQNPRAQVCTAVRPQQLCVCWALLVLLMVSQRAGSHSAALPSPSVLSRLQVVRSLPCPFPNLCSWDPLTQ